MAGTMNPRPAGAHTECPECGGTLDSTVTETTCTDCGLVVEDSPIDHGPEWRSFEDDENDPSRVGAPSTPRRHDRGMTTEIGDDWVNASAEKRAQIARLKTQHKRAKLGDKRERNLVYMLSNIRRMASALDASDAVLDRACVLVRDAQNANMLPGRTLEQFVAGAVYAACRLVDEPRIPDQVAEVARCDAEKIKQTTTHLSRELDLPLQPFHVTDHVAWIVDDLDDTDPDLRQKAMEIAAEVDGTKHASGRAPTSLAAAAVYAAGRYPEIENETQEAVADAADVTMMTVRNNWNHLRETILDN